MTTQIVRPRSIPAPAITPMRGTLLDAATVSNGIGFMDPTGLFESYNCLNTLVPTELCPAAPVSKDFIEPGWVDGLRFAVYGGVSCRGFGPVADGGLLRKAFEAKESAGVERALMETRFIAGAPPNDWDAAEDLTPSGGAVSAKAGMAILEGYAGSLYAGAATLHIPRTVASLLTHNRALELEGSTLYTYLGSKVAAGAGYEYPNSGPTGSEAAAGEAWMYASGEVFVAKGDLVLQNTIDQETNDRYGLVERAYIAAVDCFVAAVRVKVE